MANAEAIHLLTKAAPADWMDYNGHMNIAYFGMAFDQAMDVWLEKSGIGRSYVKAAGGSMFVLQNHLHYLKEIREGEDMSITLQMLDLDEKRLHVFLRLHNGAGTVAATNELLAIHVDMSTRKSAPFPAEIATRLRDQLAEHAAIPRPRIAGHRIGTKAKPE